MTDINNELLKVEVFDNEGNKINALTYCTEWVVSYSAKIGEDFKEENPFVSIKCARPENLDDDNLAALIDGQMNALRTEVHGMLCATPPPTPTADTTQPPASQQEHPSAAPQATAEGPQLARLPYGPKAEGRIPGQWWVKKATHYKWGEFTDDRGGPPFVALKLYEEGMQYPHATLKTKSPAYPTETQLENMKYGTPDRVEFPSLLYIVFKVSAKKNTKDNYYADVNFLTTSESNARPTA